MRTMIRWTVPAGPGNKAVTDGTMTATIEAMLADLKPEAAYFFTHDGKRGGLMVFDMSDSAMIPRIAEPLFQSYEAEVEFLPVMNADDLSKALSSVSA